MAWNCHEPDVGHTVKRGQPAEPAPPWGISEDKEPQQDVPSQSQSLHEPSEGPAEVPVMHSSLALHQPQVPRLVHSPQVVEVEQASVLSQVQEYQSQSSQSPDSGPKNPPSRHSSVESHQPQPLASMQAPQSVMVPQPPGTGHSPPTQLQSSQAPSRGPQAVPVKHSSLSAHQPQVPRSVQARQSPASEQGSMPQEPGSKIQASSQPPVSGPAAPPVWQDRVASHQPQSASAVQSSQVSWTEQTSVLSQVQLTVSQSSHSPSSGPNIPPTWQESVESHQPQPLRATHSRHTVSSPQGSEPQSREVHCQVSQLPSVGPPASPVMHSSELRHQPQVARATQLAQSVEVEQTSVLSQASENQSQSPHSTPPEGPIRVPA